MNNGYNNGQQNNQPYYQGNNQPNYQGNNQPNYQGNNQPAKNSGGSGKTPIIVLSVILAVVILGVGIGALAYFNSDKIGGGKTDKVVEALEEGKYSEAIAMYEKEYGYGKTDVKLNDALVERLLQIENEYRDGEISYNSAVKEIETIRSMGIDAIEDDVQQTADYVEKLEKSTNEAKPETVVETVVVGSNDPGDDPLSEENLPSPPAATIASKPYISYASTLKGSVLGASNVNGARSFGADKAIDDCYDSCWCVNSGTAGAGASIKFNLTQKSWVSGVQIVNGNLYMPYDDLYSLNGQVKTFTLTFSDGTSQTFTANYNYNASSSWQTFRLSKPVATDYVILTVQSGYSGSKFTTNVCLGEFTVF